MTLKEKFDWYLSGGEKCPESEEHEIIADEFAIEFAEWIRKEAYYEHLTKEFIYKRHVYPSEKELLEIYKKEQNGK